MGTPKTVKELQTILRDHMSREGLKTSRQRDTIAEVFFLAGGHLSVDDLLAKVREIEPKVSQATVYRTMKLLKDSGLAEPRNFFEGQTLWELADLGDHHDHLICDTCGKIFEFEDDAIEERQETIAGGLGFVVTSHRMELYGKPEVNAEGLCVQCNLTPQAAHESASR